MFEWLKSLFKSKPKTKTKVNVGKADLLIMLEGYQYRVPIKGYAEEYGSLGTYTVDVRDRHLSMVRHWAETGVIPIASGEEVFPFSSLKGTRLENIEEHYVKVSD